MTSAASAQDEREHREHRDDPDVGAEQRRVAHLPLARLAEDEATDLLAMAFGEIASLRRGDAEA
jgi:hypothetical protein